MSTTYAQPGVAPATDALLQEILLELRTSNRNLEIRDAEPVSGDEVLNKSGLETSLLDLAEGTIPEGGTLENEDGKEESEIEMKLEGPELALGAETPSSSEAKRETSENSAHGSETAVEMAHVDSAELVAQGAEDGAETGVKEEVEMLESPQCEGEVARVEGAVDGSELEVVSHNSRQVEDNDIPENNDPIHRYHWGYPWSSASEEERTKQTAGYPVTNDIKEMWSNYIGCNWAIPPDRRVGLSFDSWTLRRDADHGKERLEKLTNTLRLLKDSKLGDSSFQITDYHYDDPPKKVQYFHQNDYRTATVPEEILSRVNFHWKDEWELIWKAPWGRLM
jgi:hypothetical protein